MVLLYLKVSPPFAVVQPSSSSKHGKLVCVIGSRIEEDVAAKLLFSLVRFLHRVYYYMVGWKWKRLWCYWGEEARSGKLDKAQTILYHVMVHSSSVFSSLHKLFNYHMSYYFCNFAGNWKLPVAIYMPNIHDSFVDVFVLCVLGTVLKSICMFTNTCQIPHVFVWRKFQIPKFPTQWQSHINFCVHLVKLP